MSEFGAPVSWAGPPPGGRPAATPPATPEPDVVVVDGFLVDTGTGEVVHDGAHAARGLVEAAADAVVYLRDPATAREAARAVSERLRGQILRLWQEQRDVRPAGRVTEAVLADEVRVLLDARDVCTTVAGVFAQGAELARDQLGEVMTDLAPDDVMAATSVTVADRHGGPARKVRSTQPTEAAVEQEDLLRVLIEWVTATAQEPGAAEQDPVAVAARAAGRTLTLVESLTSPWKWKTTSLDQLGQAMDAAGRGDLQVELLGCYGRRPKGRRRVDITSR